MSQHSSFGGGGAKKQQRSVLKRYEKIEELEKKGLWTQENGIMGLPKVKVLKIKAKKEKSESESKSEGEAKDAGAKTEGAEKKK